MTDPQATCFKCGGRGWVRHDGGPYSDNTIDCPACGGTGKVALRDAQEDVRLRSRNEVEQITRIPRSHNPNSHQHRAIDLAQQLLATMDALAAYQNLGSPEEFAALKIRNAELERMVDAGLEHSSKVATDNAERLREVAQVERLTLERDKARFTLELLSNIVPVDVYNAHEIADALPDFDALRRTEEVPDEA